jgi:hypothetical protein
VTITDIARVDLFHGPFLRQWFWLHERDDDLTQDDVRVDPRMADTVPNQSFKGSAVWAVTGPATWRRRGDNLL